MVDFDRGDVSWLRGYCHFLAALGELCLSVDGQKAFDCSAHLLFEKVETPHTFLLKYTKGGQSEFQNFCGLPGGRKQDSRPKAWAVGRVQSSLPNGRPRSTE